MSAVLHCPGFNAMDHCDQLPDELLLMIFRYLSKQELTRCSSVCSRWRRVCSDENLWKEVHLKREKISVFSLGNLMQRGVETMTLKFSTISDRAFVGTICPSSNKSRLQCLDLSFTTISEKSLYSILKDTQHLVTLTLWKCKLNLQICEAIGRNRNLQGIDLFGCDGLESQGLATILNGCQRIRYLNLAYTTMSVDTLDTLTSCLRPSVLSLDFLSYGRNTLLDRHMMDIVRACPNLQYLNIRCNTALTHETDNAIRKLQHLKRYYR